MDTVIKKKGDSRIDLKVSSEDKELFNYAKALMGFTSLSEFVRHILTKESKAIVEEKNRILASERDKEIFFNALLETAAPNEALSKAAKAFKKEMD